jgi:hypothetical protein
VDLNPTLAPSNTKSTDGEYPAIALTNDFVHVVFQDKHVSLSGVIDVWHTRASLNNLIVTTSIVFDQSEALCDDLIIPAGETIGVVLHSQLLEGSMPANPAIDARIVIQNGAEIITLTNPVYTAGADGEGLLEWSGALLADITIPSGSIIELELSTEINTALFKIAYDSQEKDSRIVLPTSTYIEIVSLELYDAPYPAGNLINVAPNGETVYIRTRVVDPFGAADILSSELTFTDPLNNNTTISRTDADVVEWISCGKLYEYAWTPSLITDPGR